MSTDPPAAYTILLVDDDPGLLKVIAMGLQVFGNYQVVTARDGLEGLERFYEVRPDCVVLDVKMPEMSGHAFARALRGDPETAGTPLVMLSALAKERDEFAGMASGADQYLRKPVTPEELVQAIATAIQTSQEQRFQQTRELAEQSRTVSLEGDQADSVLDDLPRSGPFPPQGDWGLPR